MRYVVKDLATGRERTVPRERSLSHYTSKRYEVTREDGVKMTQDEVVKMLQDMRIIPQPSDYVAPAPAPSRVRVEGTEMWEVYGPTDKEIEQVQQTSADRHAEALAKVQEWIVSHSSGIALIYESEDGSERATMRDLQEAVNAARTEELESFLEATRKQLFFEDGYITVQEGGRA